MMMGRRRRGARRRISRSSKSISETVSDGCVIDCGMRDRSEVMSIDTSMRAWF